MEKNNPSNSQILSLDHTSNHNQELEDFTKNFRFNKILCVGAGYVGGPTMAYIALKCPHLQVHVVDTCEQRINMWNSENLPIYEPGLSEIVKVCRNRNLFFSSGIKKGIMDCDIIFVCVNTPTKKIGIGAGSASDLTNWEIAGRMIADASVTNKIIVEKSTVPVRTAESLARVLEANKRADVKFCIISNPEFLSEGTAIQDLCNPDRILIGGALNNDIGKFSVKVICDIYSNWIDEKKIITTNLWSAELSKLVANAFLSQRLSSINSLTHLCEKTGADIMEVSHSIGLDTRIGSKFLAASVGFGGSCFKKDVLNLIYLCQSFGLRETADYWLQVVQMNEHQKNRFASLIVENMYKTIRGKKLAVFGFSFKKNTNDTRETPALDICSKLMAEGADIYIYDVKVSAEQIRQDFKNLINCGHTQIDLETQLHCAESPLEAVENAHAIILITDWDEFKEYDYESFYHKMQKPAFFFDGKNLLDNKMLWKIGYNSYSVGKTILLQGNPLLLEEGLANQ